MNLNIQFLRALSVLSVILYHLKLLPGGYLGGTVWIGTLLLTFGIGPCVALGLYLVDKTFD